jgi:hypothetical protein
LAKKKPGGDTGFWIAFSISARLNTTARRANFHKDNSEVRSCKILPPVHPSILFSDRNPSCFSSPSGGGVSFELVDRLMDWITFVFVTKAGYSQRVDSLSRHPFAETFLIQLFCYSPSHLRRLAITFS